MSNTFFPGVENFSGYGPVCRHVR